MHSEVSKREDAHRTEPTVTGNHTDRDQLELPFNPLSPHPANRDFRPIPLQYGDRAFPGLQARDSPTTNHAITFQ